MPTRKTPTLADIWQKLGAQDEKLEAIHEQVKATNGRVGTLEQKERDRTFAENYVEKHPLRTVQEPTVQEEKGKWTAREKTLTAIILSLIALTSAAIGTGKL